MIGPKVLPLAGKSAYVQLPAAFYARVEPTPVSRPRMLRVNRPLAKELGIDADRLLSEEGVAILAGNRLPEGADALALAYAGHQFGGFSPRLGDGRAVLLGEVVGPTGIRRDIQLKGSGPTPFSRRGDGRAPLGPVIREYLASEAMAGLGIETTRVLAMVTTGDVVYREQPEPGAVLTRVARSHVRIGTFEYAARISDDAVRALADHVIARHAPEALEATNPYRALLERITSATAELIASWMLVGFVHGVMNTDNMSVAGETIDYGPFAFLDRYHPAAVFSAIDTGGRYAFDQQPHIGLWNLARLAESLLPLLDEDAQKGVAAAHRILDGYLPRFEAAYDGGLCRKIGLEAAHEGDVELAHQLLAVMAREGADYTLMFRRLSALSREPTEADDSVCALVGEDVALREWLVSWRERLALENRDDDARVAAMRAINPGFILREHLLERVIAAAREGDLAPLDDLLSVLARPFADHPEHAAWANAPGRHERVVRTFCGT